MLDADGELIHAKREADELRNLGSRLRGEALSQRKAREARTLSGPEALESRASLLDGRYSIIDHFEERGRRVFLVFENPYFFKSPRALSPRQRDVVALAARGQDNRTIA